MTVPPPPPPSEPHKLPGKSVGALVGLVVLILCFVTLSLDFGSAFGFALMISFASIIGATFAMVSPRLRPYAIGYLIFWGASLVVLGGLCVALIASYSQQV